MESKRCRLCNVDSPIAAFGANGTRRQCKVCERERTAAWRLKNPDYGKEYYQKNRETHLARTAARYLADPAKKRASEKKRIAANPEAQRQRAARWREQNREAAREITRRHDRKVRSSPRGRLDNAISAGISGSLAKGSKAGRKWQALVGYDLAALVQHLESQFLPGMTWDNYGEWHVDHVIPISAFNYE